MVGNLPVTVPVIRGGVSVIRKVKYVGSMPEPISLIL